MSQPTDTPNSDLFPIALPADATTFTGISGKTYFVERKNVLSVARDRVLEQIGLHSMLGRDAMAVLKEIRLSYDSLNKQAYVDAGVRLHNLMKGASDLASKYAPLYQVCTLFINEENEDRRTYDHEYAQRKIADWEHIERDFFLGSGLAYLNTTSAQLSEVMAGFLAMDLPNLSLSPDPDTLTSD